MQTQQRTWQYLTLIAVVAVGFSCNTSKQTAQTGEADDLYGNSGNAVVYADNSSSYTEKRPATARPETQSNRNTGALRRNNRNANPDYADDQQPYSANQDEYYSELSTRNVNRGLSADPGWGSNGTGSYNDGFTNGYYAGLNNPAYNSSRWNQWGFNNSLSNGFNIGLGLGAGMYGYNSFGSPFGYSRFGFGNSFGYSPFGYGGGYGYSPFGYGGGFYDPFYSSYGYGGYGGFGGYSPFGYGYSPFGYGGGYGYGGYNSPVYVNNSVIVSGADPYRNTRTYGARGGSSNGRYNDGFVNSTPANTNGGRSAATGNNSPSSSYSNRNSTGNSDSYYASPRQNSRSNSGYYYGNDGSTGGRSAATGNSTYSPPSNSNSGSGDYYARPRQNGGSYTPTDGSNSRGSGSGRSGYQQQSQPSYQQSQPSYQQRSSQQSQPSYQQSQSSYSAPSYNSGGSRGSSGGGYSGGGGGSSAPSGGGGGGRGPR